MDITIDADATVSGGQQDTVSGSSADTTFHDTATLTGFFNATDSVNGTVRIVYTFPTAGTYNASGKAYITDSGQIYGRLEQYQGLGTGGTHIASLTFILTKQ